MVVTKIISLISHNPALKLMDITGKVDKVVKSSKIKDGTVLVFSRHTTAAIILQENEKGLGKDFHNLLYSIAPKNGHYHHSNSADHLKDKMPNGHAHCQHVLLGSQEIIPLFNSRMMLGQYQKIFLVELDRSRQREIVVTVCGE